MKKFLASVILILSFAFSAYANVIKYEYKIVSLGSLTSLQKDKTANAKTNELEGVLNKYGAEGWEISEIFAVRTTFDPNVFFVILKRPLE